MRAAFLAIGSELLGTDRLDTNSLRVTETFERFGVSLVRKSVVADDAEEIVRELFADGSDDWKDDPDALFTPVRKLVL